MNLIRELRREAGLTLEELAERVGTTPQQISRLEKGTRRLTQEWMSRIARALSVPIWRLIPQPGATENFDQIAQNAEEFALLRFWRGLDASTQLMLLQAWRAEGLIAAKIADPQDGPRHQPAPPKKKSPKSPSR